jgi:LAGLIDADG DNA endonuclease family protein
VFVRQGVYDSDNVTGDADNQQERLAGSEAANWFLAGFIEGEGSLTVSVKRHPACRSGFYVDPDFFLYQHESGRRILELARAIFESGRISPKPGNTSVLVYEVSSRSVIREKVIPFFERYVVPFSCKRRHLSDFARSSR